MSLEKILIVDDETPVREVLCRTCRNLANHCRASGDETRSQLFAGFVAEFAATYARP